MKYLERSIYIKKMYSSYGICYVRSAREICFSKDRTKPVHILIKIYTLPTISNHLNIMQFSFVSFFYRGR